MVKFPATLEAKKHIENIKNYIEQLKELGFKIVEKVEDEKIISKVIEAEELDKIIVSKIKEGYIEKAYEEIENWYSYVKERLEKESSEGQDIFEKYEIEISDEIKEKMNFIKHGFIDLSFENIFYEDGYLFYDQEWYFKNIPLEFILYRAINNLYAYNTSKLEQKVKKEEMLKRFDLNNFVLVFEQLENKIQKEILDESTVNQYRNKIGKYCNDLEEVYESNVQIKKQYEIIKEENENLNLEKESIENKYNQLMKEYNTSRTWKLIKGFRKFWGKE